MKRVSLATLSVLTLLAVSLVASPVAAATSSSSTTKAKSAPAKTAPAKTAPATATPGTAAKGAATAAATAAKPAAAALVDLNTATKADLMKLPGVGEAISAKIIANRPYANKAQLLTRKLVNQATYDKISALIVAKQAAAAKK